MSAVKSGYPQVLDRREGHAELARVRKARRSRSTPTSASSRRAGSTRRSAASPIVNFSSNDYLGLTNHPKVKEAATKAARQVRLRPLELARQATTVEHVELERGSAQFFGYEKCLTFTTGYQAMLGLIAVDRRQGHDARPRQLQPRVHPRRQLPRRRDPGRPRDPLLQPQLGQEPRAHPEDARAEERARRSSRASIRSTATSRTSREFVEILRALRGACSPSTTRTAAARSGKHGRASPRIKGVEGRVPVLMIDVLEGLRRHRRRAPRQGGRRSTS